LLRADDVFIGALHRLDNDRIIDNGRIDALLLCKKLWVDLSTLHCTNRGYPNTGVSKLGSPRHRHTHERLSALKLLYSRQ
jgi:hypothetical protein